MTIIEAWVLLFFGVWIFWQWRSRVAPRPDPWLLAADIVMIALVLIPVFWLVGSVLTAIGRAQLGV